MEIAHSPSPESPIPEQTQDVRDLRTLAICHYIVGALTILQALVAIPSIRKVAALAGDPEMLRKFAGSSSTVLPTAFFQSFFSVIIFGMLIYTILRCVLILVSGSKLRARKHRMFSFVLSAFNCAAPFLGTLLGIFTIIVLSRDSVKVLYGVRNS